MAQNDPNSNNNSNNSNNSDNSNDSDSNSNNPGNSNSNPPLIPIIPIGPLILVPKDPTNVDISRTCADLTKPGDLFQTFKQTTTFTWTDASNNETGFNIFKDGQKVAALAANTQKYIDEFTVLLPKIPTVTYGMQAFTNSGTSNVVTATVSYCK